MKLLFNYNVPDKLTGQVYEAGKVYEFTNERGNEVLKVINRDTGLPFAVEFNENAQKSEDIVQKDVEKDKNAQSNAENDKIVSLEELTINELKELATSENIELTASKKADIIEEINNAREKALNEANENNDNEKDAE